ncbi:MAG: hypothetical protein ACI8ZX_000517 [Planctomycetota bacterium]|jgi:hypothetical protein
MKNIIILLLSFITTQTFSQVDFVKYFDGKKVEIESSDFEDDVLFINDVEVNLSNVALLSIDGALQANVYKVDAKKLRTVTNLNTNYLFAERTIKGKMNMFEYYLSKGSKKSKYPRQFFNLGDDGSIKIANVKNLLPYIKNNSLSMKYLKKAKTSKLIKTISFWSAVSLVTIGATILGNGNGNSNIYIGGGTVLGIGVLLGATYAIFPFEKIKRKNITKTIENY